MNEHEKIVMRKLIEARKAVKRKLFAIKVNKTEEDELLDKTYKPLIEPLTRALHFRPASSSTIKTEYIKNEENVSEASPVQETFKKRKATNDLGKARPKRINFIGDEEEVFESNPSAPEQGSENDDDDEEITSNRTLYQTFMEDNSPEVREEFLQQYDPLTRYYMEGMIEDTSHSFDHKTGVFYNPNIDKFSIGNVQVEFVGKDIKILDRTYEGTQGLYELLFKKSPIGHTNNDLRNYKDILNLSNAMRRNYDPNRQIRGTRDEKYTKIIKPLFDKNSAHLQSRPRLSSAPSTRLGTGHNALEVTDKPYQYIYWNDINELIERLCLLHSSKAAGNTSHQNEILAIEEELREAKVIE